MCEPVHIAGIFVFDFFRYSAQTTPRVYSPARLNVPDDPAWSRADLLHLWLGIQVATTVAFVRRCRRSLSGDNGRRRFEWQGLQLL